MKNLCRKTAVKLSVVVATAALVMPLAPVQAQDLAVEQDAVPAAVSGESNADAQPHPEGEAELSPSPLDTPWLQERADGRIAQVQGARTLNDASSLSADTTFKHVGASEAGTQKFELRSEIEVTGLEDPDQTISLDSLSFVRNQYDVPTQWVEDITVNGVSLSDDKAEVFEYPDLDSYAEAGIDYAVDIPSDVTGDLITVDTHGIDLPESFTVSMTVHLPEETPAGGRYKWELYTGSADAFTLNSTALAVDSGARLAPEYGAVPAGHARVVVQVGGDQIYGPSGRNAAYWEQNGNGATRVPGRLPSTYGFTAGEGAQLQLYAPRDGRFGNSEAHSEMTSTDPLVPIKEPWATCTTDSNGECVFNIPTTGRDVRPYYWIGMSKASPGYTAQPLVRIGGSGNSFTSTGQAMHYIYATPNLTPGSTFYSGVNVTRSRNTGYGADWQGIGNSAAFMYEVQGNGSNHRSSLGVIQQVRDNPAMPERCGLNVALVVDLSGSMGSQGLKTIKGVVNSVASRLQGTDTNLGLFNFAENSPAKRNGSNLSSPVSVSTQSGQAAIKKWVDGLAIPTEREGQATNWQEALYQVAQYNEQNPSNQYDVVYMITDGNPTVRKDDAFGNADAGEGFLTPDGAATEFRDVEGAIGAANMVKAQGTRIVAVGIPSNWRGVITSRDDQLAVSDENLKAISGGSGHQGGKDNLRAADFAQFEDSEVMQTAIINSLNSCAITVERRFYGGEDPNALPTPENTRGTNEETVSGQWSFHSEETPPSGRVTTEDKIPNAWNRRRDNYMSEFALEKQTTYPKVVIREDPSKIPEGWVRMDAEGGKRAQCFDPRGAPVEVNNLPAGGNPAQHPKNTTDDGLTNDFSLTNVPVSGVHCIVYYQAKPADQPFKFKLNKVDSMDNTISLDGAQFALTGLDKDNAGEKKPITVPGAVKGEFHWDKLATGRYELRETKPADHGYVMLSEPVYFRVATAKEGNKEVTKLYLLAGKDDRTGREVADPDKIETFPVTHFGQTKVGNEVQVTMKVANTKGGTLPKTGGHGVYAQMLFGLVLLLTGAFTARRRSAA